MTTEPIESHAVHSRRMLDHAAEMLTPRATASKPQKKSGAPQRTA